MRRADAYDPTVVGLLGLIGVVVANELLVRLVEEPHLRRVHGEAYARDYQLLLGLGEVSAHGRMEGKQQ